MTIAAPGHPARAATPHLLAHSTHAAAIRMRLRWLARRGPPPFAHDGGLYVVLREVLASLAELRLAVGLLAGDAAAAAPDE
jgi:hypothetical protein